MQDDELGQVTDRHCDTTTLQEFFARDPELQQAFIEIAKFARRISRGMVIDLHL